MKNEKDPQEHQEKHSRFIRKSIVAAFIVVIAQLGFKDIKEIAGKDDVPPKSEESIHIPEEIDALKTQVIILQNKVDTLTRIQARQPGQKDLRINSFDPKKDKTSKQEIR